jgi:hypothetical protein
MKYLCLICIDEEKLEALSPAERAAFVQASIDHDAALAKRAVCVTAASLKPVETATTVRLKNGRPAVTDGPFAATREHLEGFILIDAVDLDEAIDIAARIPALRLGCVEIRATRELHRVVPRA